VIEVSPIDRYYVSKVVCGLLEQLVPGRLRLPADISRRDKELIGLADPFVERVERVHRAWAAGGWRPVALVPPEPEDDPPAGDSPDPVLRYLLSPETAQAVQDQEQAARRSGRGA
jgi:hypothetical protein